jgi:hypothetical protein
MMAGAEPQRRWRVPVEREAILVDNIRGCLDLYQRSIVWAMTASLVFFLLSLRLGNTAQPPVQILYAEMSLPAAWFAALVLFFLLGGFALSAIRRAELNLTKLNPFAEVREAVLLYPSLATSRSSLFRVGSVVLCPFAVLVAFAIELHREWEGQVGKVMEESRWVGLLVFFLIIIGIYGAIVSYVWRPFGSRPTNRLFNPTA